MNAPAFSPPALSLPQRLPRYTPRAVAHPAPARPRFTTDGDVALENHLTRTCARIAAGLSGLLPAHRLQAVLLGGGYGRGEGGVWRTDTGDRPYNDLEFYVFLRGDRRLNERRYGRALHVFGEILTPQAGIDVEFRIASLEELTRGEVTMFSYDLVCGHRCIAGDDNLLAGCDAHRDAEAIPPAEATRLLMNRATGLLLARERLERPVFTAGDADFVARNIAKAQLGAGDAVLTAFGQYHWSVTERHRRLERLVRSERASWLASVCRHHATGVEFKLHPVRSNADRETQHVQHAAVSEQCRDVWLWLESRRLRTPFRSVRAYADHRGSRCPESQPLRNVAVNASVFGRQALKAGALLRHPRERILAALPVLLWQSDALTSPASRAQLQRELCTEATDLPGFVAAYRKIWERVN